jgi:hypothetical protein
MKWLLVIMVIFFLAISGPDSFCQAYPANHEELQENCIEFVGYSGEKKTIGFCGLEIGNQTWITVEHGPVKFINKLERMGMRIVKSDKVRDIAILTRRNSPDFSSIKVAKARKGEMAWIIEKGQWTSVKVVWEAPLLIEMNECPAGYSGKPVFNRAGQLIGIIESGVVLKKTGELLCVGCVSGQMIEEFLTK